MIFSDDNLCAIKNTRSLMGYMTRTGGGGRKGGVKVLGGVKL